MADSNFPSAATDAHDIPAAPTDLSPDTTTTTTTTPSASALDQATATAQSTLSSVSSSAQSAISSISNHPTVQSVTSGPVAQNVKSEANKTGNEFQALANSRATPSQPAATGQPLTHYHSLFYNLLSWENPRATAVTYVSIVLFIFAARYLNFISYLFKLTAYALGVTTILEVTGKALFDSGISTRLRPRKYYTIPRESLERCLEDVEQLINFFVVEAQRILFAENVLATLAAFLAAGISYGLIKIVPFWGLTLIGVTALFGFPLIYTTNKETIDGLLNHASEVASSQAAELRRVTAEHTGRATEQLKSYTSEYTALAQNYVGGARKTTSPHPTHEPIKSENFPTVPKTEEVYPSVPKTELGAGSAPSTHEVHEALNSS